jgi:hypothetical protein
MVPPNRQLRAGSGFDGLALVGPEHDVAVPVIVCRERLKVEREVAGHLDPCGIIGLAKSGHGPNPALNPIMIGRGIVDLDALAVHES